MANSELMLVNNQVKYFERQLCAKTSLGTLGSFGVTPMASTNALTGRKEQKLCLSEDCYIPCPQGQKCPALGLKSKLPGLSTSVGDDEQEKVEAAERKDSAVACVLLSSGRKTGL